MAGGAHPARSRGAPPPRDERASGPPLLRSNRMGRNRERAQQSHCCYVATGRRPGERQRAALGGGAPSATKNAIDMPIRPAAVAGTWYPGTAGALTRDVDGYLQQAADWTGGPIQAMLAPHAGLMFSGP